MRRTALFLLALFSYGLIRAQEISGTVKDSHGNFLTDASVALKKIEDSTLVKASLSDNNGRYSFTGIRPGHYFIAVSHVSFLPAASSAFTVTDDGSSHIPPIELSPAPGDLQQAQVTAVRPLLEFKPGKLVLNVAGNINAIGENALDLLRKSPGVTVDNSNVISLNGKNGTRMYIDNRPTYLSGTALAQYLESLQSTSIESIEFITNPSARYEAAGSGGIINIRLKKDRSLGTNVTAGLGYNVGTYSKYDANFGFNHRDRRLNVFGDYAWHDGTQLGHSVYYRTLPDSLFRQRDSYTIKANSQTFHGGLDYFVNKHSTLGVLITGMLITDSVKSNSLTPIIYTPANTTSRLLVADNRTSELQDNYDVNLNYHFAGDKGHSFDLNADYGLYRIRSNQLQPNNFFDSTGQHLINSIDYNILSPTDIDIYSLKADYSLPVFKGQLGLGVKSSWVTSTNIFQQYDLTNSERLFDSLNSDNFSYKENINAAYAEYNRTFTGGLILQAGLRVENTNGKGVSTGWQQITGDYSGYDSAYPRHYTDLFPSASLTWKQWTLTYGRRIDRPNYPDLNPFEFKVDDYTFSKGNTQLQPQYTTNLGLTWSYKYSLSATLGYSHITDLFTTVPEPIDQSKTVTTSVNLNSKDIYDLNITYSIQYKWYSAFVNVDGFYALYKANLGPGQGIDLNIFHTTVTSQNSFQLGKGWSASLGAYFSSPNIWNATLRVNSMGSLDAGIQKTFLNGRATLKAAVSDILYTMSWAATSNFDGQHIYTAGDNDSRRLKVNFVYRFGNTQVKAARRHVTGAEDENNRGGGRVSGSNY